MNKDSQFFTSDTIKFLNELSENNNKEWFHSHKKEYEEYYKIPLRKLVDTMSKRFAELQLPYHSSAKLSLFRINRDIRFSKNKEPYKSNIGIFFPYSLYPLSKKSVDKPGLYFHLEPGQSFIAGGIYMPTSDDIIKIRAYIAENWEELDEILSSNTLTTNFPIILPGETLKRIPRGFDENHPKADWLKMKSFILETEVEDEIFTSNELTQIIETKAISIAPYLDFLYNAINEQE
jgi:uncharacterized protein (TIGR02453 family)